MDGVGLEVEQERGLGAGPVLAGGGAAARPARERAGGRQGGARPAEARRAGREYAPPGESVWRACHGSSCSAAGCAGWPPGCCSPATATRSRCSSATRRPVPDTPEAAWGAWERARRRPVPPGALPPVARRATCSRPSCPTCSTRSPPPARRASTRSTACRPAIADRAPRPGDDRFAHAARAAARRSSTSLARAAEAQPGLTVRRGDAGVRAHHAPGPTASARRRRPHRGRARRSGRPGGRRDGPRLAHAAPRRGRGRASGGPEEAEDSRLHLLHALLPRRCAARAARPAADAVRQLLDPHRARRRRARGRSRVYVASGDRPLKRLRHEAAWTALVRACPLPGPLARRRADHGRAARWPASSTAAARPRPRSRASPASATLGRARTRRRAAASRSGLMPRRLLRDVVRAHVGDPARSPTPGASDGSASSSPWYRRDGRHRPRAARRDGGRPRRARAGAAGTTGGRAARGARAGDGPRRRRVPRRAGDLDCLAHAAGGLRAARASPAACWRWPPSRRRAACRGPTARRLLRLVA